MSTLERLTADDLAGGDDWTTAQAPPLGPAALYDPALGRRAQRGALLALSCLERATARLGGHLVGTLGKWHYEADMTPYVRAIERVAGLRRSLAELEAILTRAAAYASRDLDMPRAGTFPDGRLWELKRGADRKAWDHGSWLADVRREVLSGLPALLVDPETGVEVDPRALLVGVQSVHGAGPPRVAALKRLGLDPGDYCETVAGSWGLKVSAPGSDDE